MSMEMFNYTVSLWVIGAHAVKAKAKKLNQCVPQVNRNLGTRYVERSAGTPNLATQLNRKALAHVFTVASGMSVASGQRVSLSTVVKR